MINFFSTAFNEIINYRINEPVWIVSQIFAFIALVFMIWSFQCKQKLRVMLCLGFATLFLSISAMPLQNWTLAFLFLQESVRNFLFFSFDLRVKRGKHVPRKYYNIAACTFAVLIIVSTVTIIHILGAPHSNYFVEWGIAVTQIGILLGIILKGQNFMRVCFMINRTFNSYNHIYFANAFGLMVALSAIGSNVVYYLRMLVGHLRKKGKQ